MSSPIILRSEGSTINQPFNVAEKKQESSSWLIWSQAHRVRTGSCSTVETQSTSSTSIPSDFPRPKELESTNTISTTCKEFPAPNVDGIASTSPKTSGPDPLSILSCSTGSLLKLPRTTQPFQNSSLPNLPAIAEASQFGEASLRAFAWYRKNPTKTSSWNWNNFENWGTDFEQLHDRALADSTAKLICANLRSTQAKVVDIAKSVRDLVVLYVLLPLIPVFALFPTISLTRLILVLVLPMVLVLLRPYWLPTVVTLLQPLSEQIRGWVGYTAERYSTLCLEPGSHRIVPCPVG